MSIKPDDPLVLAKSLTQRAERLCTGLASGTADLYDLVTPTTAQLLRWWFGGDARQTRAFNFHPGQRQALDDAIHLLRAAGRQVAFAPQRFEEADGGIVIFGLGFCRLDHRSCPDAPCFGEQGDVVGKA